MLLRMADGRTTFIDFRERAPQKATRDMYLDAAGKATAIAWWAIARLGVPGTVRGMEYAWQKFGSKKWAELVAPAAALASKATRSPTEASLACSGSAAARALSGIQPHLPARRQILRMGDTSCSPTWRVLERIPSSARNDFYEGETARLLAADQKEHGGLITLADLKNYKAIERKPLTGSIAATTSSPRRRPVPAASASCKCWACWKERASRRPAPGSAKAGALS
jgi:gamma-glutamyltranspeptidase / glutathione hydrolase